MFGAYAGSFVEDSEEPIITDPVTEIPWKSVFWASSISSRPAEGGAAPSSITNLGTDGGDWVKNNAVLWTRGFGGSIRDAAVFGSGNFYSLTSPSYGERTVVVIGQVGDTDNVDMFDTAPTRTVVDASGGNFRLFAGDVTEAGPADTDPHLFVVHVVSGGSTSFEIDGDLKATGTASQAGGTALSLGDSGLGSGNAPGSKVAFAGYIDRALTTNEKAALLTWYRSFYAPVFFGLENSPANTASYGDGGTRIRLGTWFYSAGGLNDGWLCSGGRVYIAADWPGLTGYTVRISALLRASVSPTPFNDGSFDAAITPAGTVDVVCKGTGWIEGSWEPFEFHDGQAVFIMYEWLAPFNGTYTFQAGSERVQPSAIESPSLPGLFLAEGPFNRCYFTTDTADSSIMSPSFAGAWYGCDIIVEAP